MTRCTRVALTGGIGSGKSTVAALLAEKGAVVVDADKIARELVEPGRPALAEIVAEFGDEILTPDGRLDRAGLAAVVFLDPERLAALNRIVHPRIVARSEQLLQGAEPGSTVVYDMPLLLETGQIDGWDFVIVVEAARHVRMARLVARGMSESDVVARIAAQGSDERRRALADYVIVNDGDRGSLSREVDHVWRLVGSRAADLGESLSPGLDV